MQLKEEQHIFTGMQQDLSVSKHPESSLYEAKNIRITSRGDNTLLSITNEKGPLDINTEVTGTYLGHCLLNEYLVIFSTTSTSTTKGTDYITRINLALIGEYGCKKILYEGNINFHPDYKIEALPFYENMEIQKVYWTDGYNQPRVINIVKEVEYNSTSFDFVQELELQETVKITKLSGANGEFPAGVIQYAFTYFNKYGQESNIFHVTPLQYISYKDRGGSPEDKIPVAFKIKVTNLDSHFNSIRIYSILRTSINSTPVVKRIQDVLYGNNKTVTITDTNQQGEDVDPTQLLYVGGEEIVAKTLDQKDGTLFFGNIELKRPSIPETVKQSLKNILNINNTNGLANDNLYPTLSKRPYLLINTEPISYVNTLSCPENFEYQGVAGFKSNEYYRLGLQFQYKNGKWSEPCWIGDKQCKVYPSLDISGTDEDYDENTGVGFVPEFILKSTYFQSLFSSLYELGYRKIRPLFVYPNTQDKTILCQGVANYTLKADKNEYYQPSWLFRTNIPTYNDFTLEDGGGIVSSLTNGLTGESLKSQFFTEVISSQGIVSPYKRSTEIMGNFKDEDIFKLNYDLITINTPDLIWDDYLYNANLLNCKAEVVGYTEIINTYGDIDIQTSTSPSLVKGGFKHSTLKTLGYGALMSGNFWEDAMVDKSEDNGKMIIKTNLRGFPVFMWHKTGSLNNCPSEFGMSKLLTKKISNYRFCDTTEYLSTLDTQSEDIQIFKNDELQLLKTKSDFYMGNIDTLLVSEESRFYYSNADYATNPSVDYSYRTGYTKEGDLVYTNRGVYKLDPTDYTWKHEYDLGTKDIESVLWRSAIPMRYKTTPHLIAKVNKNPFGPCVYHNPINSIKSYTLKLEPSVSVQIDNNGNISYSDNRPIVPNTTNSLEGDKTLYIDENSKGKVVGFLPIGTLPVIDIKKDYNKDILFGGLSDVALQNALWIPCGPSIDLTPNGTTSNINFKWGDTYFQRFEILKTYAFSPEDINQVVEIASVLLESRINMDGRYDKNRGQQSNLNINNTNFNLLNPIYSQSNNFFNYRLLDKDYYTMNKFPNQITWTTEKQAGADTDAWTNITLASTYDLDGSRGEITSLNTWKENIYCFQTKGVSSLLFNSRVQIPTSDGMPIEITNSYKMDGYRYLTNGIGCSNKYTIKDTANGLYFIDTVSNQLYKLTDKVENISESLKMSSWFNGNTILKTLYDDIHKDLYFITNNTALCFSEFLNQFVSFMDYPGIDLLESYNKQVFTMKSKKLYKMFNGEYNKFFNVTKPWEITFISNGNAQNLSRYNKIFSNIEYRMDVYSSTGEIKHSSSFDYLRITDEYQDTGKTTLTQLNNKPSNLKKKFRVWRITIPRDNGKRTRISNTWCKVILGKENNNDACELHDLIMQFYI